jgi:hypothetical protein
MTFLSCADRGPTFELTVADRSSRQPRVPRVISPPTRVEEVKASVSLEPASTPSISPVHLARIRTSMRYGMTIAQVAAVRRLAGRRDRAPSAQRLTAMGLSLPSLVHRRDESAAAVFTVPMGPNPGAFRAQGAAD